MLGVKFLSHDRPTVASGSTDNEPAKGLARKHLCYYKAHTLPFLTKFVLYDINKLITLLLPTFQYNMSLGKSWNQ